MRPVTKYGRWVVWPGGYSRSLSLRERLLFLVGLLREVAP